MQTLLDEFPGCMAVDNHKDDEEIKFLFVNTFESGEELVSNIRKILEKNNYSFQVLLDQNTDNDSQYKTARDYNITVMPARIIIGPDGKLKFRKIGAAGTVYKLYGN